MKKKLFTFLVAAAMTAAMSFTAMAAGWQQDSTGWWWLNDDGTWPANTWMWLDGNHDTIAECYYFYDNGYMAANTTTPDGYTVDASGAWTVNGVVQTKVQPIVGDTGTFGGGAGGTGGGSGSNSGGGSGSESNINVSTDSGLQALNGTYRLTSEVSEGKESTQAYLDHIDMTLEVVILDDGSLQYTEHNAIGTAKPKTINKSGENEWTSTSGNLSYVYEFPDTNTMIESTLIKDRALGELVTIRTFTRE